MAWGSCQPLVVLNLVQWEHWPVQGCLSALGWITHIQGFSSPISYLSNKLLPLLVVGISSSDTAIQSFPTEFKEKSDEEQSVNCCVIKPEAEAVPCAVNHLCHLVKHLMPVAKTPDFERSAVMQLHLACKHLKYRLVVEINNIFWSLD